MSIRGVFQQLRRWLSGSATLRVLVAIDDSADSQSAIVWLPEWFQSPKTDVTLASVVSRQASTEEVRRAHAALDLSRPGIGRLASCESVVLRGEPTEALRDYAMTHDIHLVVMGTRGAGGSVSTLGSVAESFARDSGLVVLFVEDDAARRKQCLPHK